ncbi:hypothetical protein [Paenibacillus mendelii]|uniref:Uncharacterized protein n=1 Tax=Paenibacillus mendelii TaxID=206163 RepID=A0ABV6JJC7_9BACL|nr:hypothetical protein [Paenibacillus mendelii]MCQ6558945.1 hypothetical protein [Paenibacillus mendelii]
MINAQQRPAREWNPAGLAVSDDRPLYSSTDNRELAGFRPGIRGQRIADQAWY